MLLTNTDKNTDFSVWQWRYFKAAVPATTKAAVPATSPSMPAAAAILPLLLVLKARFPSTLYTPEKERERERKRERK
jgi:hypothetical protein